MQGEYEKFASGIVKSGRTMQLGIWNLGRGAAYEWAPAMSVNMTAATQKTPGVFRGAWVSDLPCNIRRRGWQSLVMGGSSLIILEGKACNPL